MLLYHQLQGCNALNIPPFHRSDLPRVFTPSSSMVARSIERNEYEIPESKTSEKSNTSVPLLSNPCCSEMGLVNKSIYISRR